MVQFAHVYGTCPRAVRAIQIYNKLTHTHMKTTTTTTNAAVAAKKAANANVMNEYLNALNQKAREFIKDESERQCRCLEDGKNIASPEAKAAAVKGCKLYLLERAKARICAAYKAAQIEYLLRTNEAYSEAQANVVLLAAMKFAERKEDGAAFVQWLKDNNKAYLQRVVDTPDRLKAALNELYKDYVNGRKIARQTAAEKAAEKAAVNNIFAQLAALTPEQRAELKAQL